MVAWRALAIAIVAHGAALGAMAALPVTVRSPRPAPLVESTEATLLEVFELPIPSSSDEAPKPTSTVRDNKPVDTSKPIASARRGSVHSKGVDNSRPAGGPTASGSATSLDDWGSSDSNDPSDWRAAIPGLGLAYSLGQESDAPPAPTEAPKDGRVVTADDTEEAIRSDVRFNDAQLGLGNPQETVVLAAVRMAGREAGVPSGTRFVASVVIDRNGNVTEASVTGDHQGSGAWPDVAKRIKGVLSQKAIPLGPDERERGARVTVNAQVLHVFASGTTELVVLGECPKTPLIGGEDAKSFFNIGGTDYREPGRGLCALGDVANATSPKTIAVRTSIRTEHLRDAPRPTASFPPKPPMKRLPSAMEIVTKVLSGQKITAAPGYR